MAVIDGYGQPASCRPSFRGPAEDDRDEFGCGRPTSFPCAGDASLDQPRSRDAERSRQPEPVELGNEPPLSVDGGNSGFVDRRRVSVQWFAGTILTALCGAALMGGAVFTSLDGETNFASLPERVEVALRARSASVPISSAVAQKRPAADRGRAQLRPPGDPRLHHQPRRQSRGRARAALRAHRRQPVADRFRSLRQYPPYNPQRLLAEIRPGRRRRQARHRLPSPMPKSLSSCATCRRYCPSSRSPCSRQTTRCSTACARRRNGATRSPTSCRSPAMSPASSSLMPASAVPILMPASKRASFRKTSRCCRKPPTRQPAAMLQ